MRFFQCLTFSLISLSACTYANIGATPVLLADGSTAYRYSGRDNFAHQRAEADSAMAKFCAQGDGGRPVIVQQGSSVIGGGIALGGGVATAMANRQQEIIFRCVK